MKSSRWPIHLSIASFPSPLGGVPDRELHWIEYDIDTIVREGEVLYIPSFWFHYIVSMSYSIQCNSLSGTPPKGEVKEAIDKFMGHREDFT